MDGSSLHESNQEEQGDFRVSSLLARMASSRRVIDYRICISREMVIEQYMSI